MIKSDLARIQDALKIEWNNMIAQGFWHVNQHPFYNKEKWVQGDDKYAINSAAGTVIFFEKNNFYDETVPKYKITNIRI